MMSKYDAICAAVKAAKLTWFDSDGHIAFNDKAKDGSRILKFYSNEEGASPKERRKQAAELLACLQHIPGVHKVTVRNWETSRIDTGWDSATNKPVTYISTSKMPDKVSVYIKF